MTVIRWSAESCGAEASYDCAVAVRQAKIAPSFAPAKRTSGERYAYPHGIETGYRVCHGRFCLCLHVFRDFDDDPTEKPGHCTWQDGIALRRARCGRAATYSSGGRGTRPR